MISRRKPVRHIALALSTALVALLSFSAVSAQAASSPEAPRWKVNGAFLGNGVTKAFTATNTTELAIAFSGIKVAAPAGQCTITGEIQGNGSFNSGSRKNVILSCTKAAVIGAANCAVNSTGSPSGTIISNSLKSEVVWLGESGEAAGDRFEPATAGQPWMKLDITGEKCAAAINAKEVTIPPITKILPVGKESTAGELVFPSPTVLNYYGNNNWGSAPSRPKQAINAFKVGAAAATLSGSFSFGLNSKESVGIIQSSAPVAPGAGTPRWAVTEAGVTSFLASGATRSFTSTSVGVIKAGLSSENIEMEKCTQTGKIVGSAAGLPGTKKEVQITCEGVHVVGGGSCVIKSPGQPAGTIQSSLLKATLVRLSSGLFGEKLEAEGGGNFFYLEQECSFTGAITGSLTNPIYTSTETEPALQSSFQDGAAALLQGVHPYTFVGSFGTVLQSGVPFTVLPG
jgi:hypothetical protein